MPGSSERRRAQQAEYQRRYRARQAALKKPSRDDVARAAFHYMVVTAARTAKGRERFAQFEQAIVRQLVKQGFDLNAARLRFAELVARYEHGWQPQRKPHLDRSDDS